MACRKPKVPNFLVVRNLILLLIFFTSPVFAVDNPASGSATVTATVPTFIKIEPDIPTLISPGNNTTTANPTPTFIFNPSLGSTFVSHYQLYIDGNSNTSNISPSTITITAHALTALSEGQHTWMIKAHGNNGTSRNSATWTFTIDTTAPLILVTDIAEHETSLSSLDLSTIPSGLTFITSQNQPIFSGQSEALAQISLTLTNQADSITFFTTVSPNHLFSISPSYNLSPGTYTVNLSSSDLAGNLTSLPAFYLEITAKTGFTIILPSPLPPITLPVISLVKFPFGPLPKIPEALTAFPILITCGFQWWWLLIILILLIIIYKQKRKIKRLTSITKPL